MSDDNKLTVQARQRRYLLGDTADWPEMWRNGIIDEATLIEKTGFRPQDFHLVMVPMFSAARVRQHGVAET